MGVGVKKSRHSNRRAVPLSDQSTPESFGFAHRRRVVGTTVLGSIGSAGYAARRSIFAETIEFRIIPRRLAAMLPEPEPHRGATRHLAPNHPGTAAPVPGPRPRRRDARGHEPEPQRGHTARGPVNDEPIEFRVLRSRIARTPQLPPEQGNNRRSRVPYDSMVSVPIRPARRLANTWLYDPFPHLIRVRSRRGLIKRFTREGPWLALVAQVIVPGAIQAQVIVPGGVEGQTENG